jgi:hypothetical protein
MTVIREVMTQQLVTVEPLTSVAAAVTVMGCTEWARCW